MLDELSVDRRLSSLVGSWVVIPSMMTGEKYNMEVVVDDVVNGDDIHGRRCGDGGKS